jgi:predicted DNA-binding protein with PD1-like motif
VGAVFLWHGQENAMLTITRRSFGVTACACLAPAAMATDRAEALPSSFTPSDFQPESGRAPSMQARALAKTIDGSRPWILVFGKGDEVMSGLADWAKREDIKAGHLTAVGALSSVLFGWFDKDLRAYKDIPVDQQVECISFLGDIGFAEGKPALHVHGSVGRPGGSLVGGHVLRAVAWPTLEVFVTVFERPLTKHKDQETDLQLFDLSS